MWDAMYYLVEKFNNFAKSIWVKWSSLLVGIFILIIVLSVYFWSDRTPSIPLTPIQQQFSAWDGEHINLTRFIKEKMNDPSSFDHISSTYVDHWTYLIVTETYRGKNAFWAKIIDKTVAKVDMSWNILSILK